MTSLASPVEQREKILAPFTGAEPSYAPVPVTTSSSLILQGDAMERIFKFAEMMSQSVVSVPLHFRGKPADCLAVVMQATQWGMNPFAVAQKTHIVNGQLGYEAQLVNAVVQASGAIVGEFDYEFSGEKGYFMCRVGAVRRGKSDITWGEWICEAEITTKNSPLWKTNPKQQLGYLQVKNWARLYSPGSILGVLTREELMDSEPLHMGNAEFVGTRAPAANSAQADDPLVADARKEAGKGRESFLAWWQKVEKSKRLALHSRLPEFEAIAKTADDARTFENGTPPAATEKPAATTAQAKPAAKPAAASGFTFESVMDRMDKAHAARDIDALNIAADLIGSVTERQRELEVVYEQYLGELS